MRSSVSTTLFAVLCICATAAGAATPSEQMASLLIRDPDPRPYEMSGAFAAILSLNVRGVRLTALGEGKYDESRSVHGRPRLWKITLSKLDVPLLLRPFTRGVERVLQQEAEGGEESVVEALQQFDLFHEEGADGIVAIGGVRKDIVTQTLRRAGRQQDEQDVLIRRSIARWLHTDVRRRIKEFSGEGPALVSAIAQQRRLKELAMTYNWGEVRLTPQYANGSDQRWISASVDAHAEVPLWGDVDAQLTVKFHQHCYNCRM